MTDDQNQKIIYSESKLISHIKKELDKPDTNYAICLTYMKNLGQLSATKDKEIDDALYNSLFSCISTIFRRADSPNVVPLSLRIICLKLLTNSCIILNSHQHTNTSSVAYSLIIKEIGNEVVKPNYSTSFIITILDAIYLCSKADCIDDKATIQALLLLSKIKNSLIPVNRDSLAIALDIDLAPFNQKYKYGPQAKEMNALLINLGCTKILSDTKAAPTFTIPQPTTITTLEQRLAAQEFLKMLSPDEIADRVINGFEEFKKVENYQPPDSITDLITMLIQGPEEVFDQQTSITDATIYIVEQALDRLNQRTKYIPLKVQSEFIAMLITTLDSTRDEYEECNGPATSAAIKRAIDPNQILVQFLVSWVNFEFVRSSTKRYENLVIQIFKNLVYVDSNSEIGGELINNSNIDENFLIDFIKNLEWLPLELYEILGQICSQHPVQSNKILTAINEYIMNKPASLHHFLTALLELSIHPLDQIHDQAIEIIKTYYKRKNEQTVSEINKFAIENLQKTLTEANPEPYLELFFAIIELNMSLFLDLMEVYAEAQGKLPQLQSTFREKLKKKITTMPYDISVIKKALEIALVAKSKTVLMHFYLSELAKRLSVPPDLVELLKKQFNSSKDSRYLIPIIPNLNEDEFKLYLPDILKLEPNALRRAIVSLLKATKPPMTPILFLIELHRPEIAGKNKDKAIQAMTICLSQSEYTYQIVSTAVEVVQKNKYHDIIMNTLSEMVKKFSNQVSSCHKFILNHIVPPLINNGIAELEEPWELMKKLIYETKPTSCKTALASFSADQIKDLITTYPDYKSLLQGTAKKISRINPAVLEAIK